MPKKNSRFAKQLAKIHKVCTRCKTPIKFIHSIKGKIVKKNNLEIEIEENGEIKKYAKGTVEHILPRHMGGKHRWNNVTALCAKCNQENNYLNNPICRPKNRISTRKERQRYNKQILKPFTMIQEGFKYFI